MTVDDLENLSPDELQRRYLCIDCIQDTSRRQLSEYYTVHDEVWAQAGLGLRDGMLCIGCLEDRLQRRLTPGDFKDCTNNIDNSSSARLKSRRQRNGSDDYRALCIVMNMLMNGDPHFDTIFADVSYYYGIRSTEVRFEG